MTELDEAARHELAEREYRNLVEAGASLLSELHDITFHYGDGSGVAPIGVPGDPPERVETEVIRLALRAVATAKTAERHAMAAAGRRRWLVAGGGALVCGICGRGIDPYSDRDDDGWEVIDRQEYVLPPGTGRTPVHSLCLFDYEIPDDDQGGEGEPETPGHADALPAETLPDDVVADVPNLGRAVCDSIDVALDVDHHLPPAARTITYDENTGQVLVLRAADGAIYDATPVVSVKRLPGIDSIRLDVAEVARLAVWLREPAPQPRSGSSVADLQAQVAVDEAEFYATGWRRLAVRYGLAPDDPAERQRHEQLVQQLIDEVAAAADAAGYIGGGTTGHRVAHGGERHTTEWHWPSSDVPAADIVRAAREVAERLNPGHWQIDADDH